MSAYDLSNPADRERFNALRPSGQAPLTEYLRLQLAEIGPTLEPELAAKARRAVEREIEQVDAIIAQYDHPAEALQSAALLAALAEAERMLANVSQEHLIRAAEDQARSLRGGRQAGADINKRAAAERKELLRDFIQGYVQKFPGATLAQAHIAAKRSSGAVAKAASRYRTVAGLAKALPGIRKAALKTPPE